MNPEARRATMAYASSRPTRITLALDASLFSIVQSPGGRAAMPMNGEEIEVNRASWPTTVKVRWDDRLPRVERSLEDGGTIIDQFELLSRDRLIIVRKVEGVDEEVEFRSVYDRQGSG